MIKTKHKGSKAELKACVWFLDQGYEVFKNVSQHGEIDLIVYDPETKDIKLVDVKSIYEFHYNHQSVKKNKPLGIETLAYRESSDEFQFVDFVTI